MHCVLNILFLRSYCGDLLFNKGRHSIECSSRQFMVLKNSPLIMHVRHGEVGDGAPRHLHGQVESLALNKSHVF